MVDWLFLAVRPCDAFLRSIWAIILKHQLVSLLRQSHLGKPGWLPSATELECLVTFGGGL